LEDLAPHVDGDLLGEVAVGNGDRHLGDVAHLRRQVARHLVHVVGEVLPRARHPGDRGLAPQLALRPHLARHPAPLRRERAPRLPREPPLSSVSPYTSLVSFSWRISPRASTVIFWDRSPRATAVATSAMFRTCPVRFDAMKFTLSVRSFHVPATPVITAWPP